MRYLELEEPLLDQMRERERGRERDRESERLNVIFNFFESASGRFEPTTPV